LSWLLESSTHPIPQNVSAGSHTHAPDTQFWFAPQARPHSPQFFGSFNVLAQPFAHAVSDPAQAHFPETQGSPAPHIVPHVPQFNGSLASAAQWAPHIAVPPGQAHFPLSHTSVASHALPQPPQLSGSLAGSMQLWPHAMNGLEHVALHMPCWQKGVAPEHDVVHIPQCIGSAARFTHAPLHSVDSAGHAHCPAAHTSPVGHAIAHAPQFFASLVVSTHAVPHCLRPVPHGVWHMPLVHVRPASQA